MIIIKEAGRKSVQQLPDFGSYSTDCSVILQVSLLYQLIHTIQLGQTFSELR